MWVQDLNLLDFVIIAIFLLYGLQGFALGLIAALFDFLGFLFSFALALKFYSFFSKFLFTTFSLPLVFSNAVGFFIAAFLFEIIINAILKRLHKPLLPLSMFWANRFLGVLAGFASATILLAFLLTLVISLPLSPFLKQIVSSSKVGSFLVSKTSGFEKELNNVFGGAVNEALTFLTVEPQRKEIVDLKFRTTSTAADTVSEKEMFELVNKERAKSSLSLLIFDKKLTDLARSHSEDMFKRGYFSHYTLEGLSPFDRMAEADIISTYAGENLALAPSVSLAMQGLMQSPGHRENILSKDFGRVGIGVIDGGIYGKMFTQEFTD
ncbi:MAG: CvpA family protein [Candidatus Levybacteria bacterium]|nr:CvpA family protein [Candidatus Levybacteria bacterium]